MPSEEHISVEIIDSPKINSPKLICGLPGSGYVGKLAVDYLIEKLHAKKFADIFSSSFPPQVSIQPDGTVDLVKNSLYHCRGPDNDFIILTGDAQPVSAQGEYMLAEEILKLCKQFKVKEVYTLAAYITGKFTKSPKVFGTSTSKEYVEKFSTFGVSTLTKGNITGMNGVLIGMAKRESVNGICLLGETSGYVIDAKASIAVLESISKILGIKIDMSELEKKAKDTEELIKTIQAQAVAQGSQEQHPMPLQPPDEKSLGYIS